MASRDITGVLRPAAPTTGAGQFPCQQPVTWPRWDDGVFRLSVVDQNGVPVNVTGWLFRLTMRGRNDPATTPPLLSRYGVITGAASAGKVSFGIASGDWIPFVEHQLYRYDVLGIDAAGGRHQLVPESMLTILPAVTQPTDVGSYPTPPTPLPYPMVSADWPLGTPRFYAVDPINGSDGNVGYSDVSMSQARLVALKTLEEWYARIPKHGAGRTFMLGLGAGVYLKKDGVTPAKFPRHGICGYAIATVRATQFLDTAADKYKLAGITKIPGPDNGDGSWTVLSISGRTITIAGGTLPTDRSANGWKVQFAGNQTSGAANTPRGLQWVRPGGTSFDVSADVTVAPGDRFWIEEPSVVLEDLEGYGDNPKATSGSLRGMAFAGIRFMMASNPGGYMDSADGDSFAFCDFPNNLEIRASKAPNFNGDYRDETGTLISIRHSLRTNYFAYIGGGGIGICRNIFTIGPSITSTICKVHFNGDMAASFLAGSYFYGVVNLSGGGYLSQSPGNTSELGPGPTSLLFSPLKIDGMLYLRGVRTRVHSVDINNTAGSGIKVGGDCHLSIANLTGTNAGYAIDVSEGLNSEIALETGVTIAGALGDILLAGSQTATFADLNTGHATDSRGNIVQGAAGVVVTRRTQGTVANVPLLTADPAAPANKDWWIRSDLKASLIRDAGTTKKLGAIDIGKAGTSVAERHGLNLIEGANVTITAVDNSGTNAVDVTIAATSSGPSPTRTFTAGAGLTGGGDLSADRTFSVGANVDGSIAVNADDIAVGVLATDAQHGVRGGSTLHALATTSAAGFMSAADKAKLDSTIADWANPTVCRYYLLDVVNGVDTNAGYIEAAPGATFTPSTLQALALKTWGKLYSLLCKEGADRLCVVLLRGYGTATTYVKADGTTGDEIVTNGLSGFRRLIIRGSNFTNDANDKIDCEHYIAHPGPDAGQTFTVTGFNSTTLQVTVSSGLTTGTTLVGAKVQWTGNVTTALRTNSPSVQRVIDSTNMIVGRASVAPAVGDTFTLRRPSVLFTRHIAGDAPSHGFNASDSATRGLTLVGVEFTKTGSYRQYIGDEDAYISVLYRGTPVIRSNGVSGQQMAGLWYDETGATINARCGIHFANGATIVNMAGVWDHVTSCGSAFQVISAINNMTLRAGGFFDSSPTFSGGALPPSKGNTSVATLIGALVGSGFAPTYFDKALRLRAFAGSINGVTIANAASPGGIQLSDECDVTLENCLNGSGNVGYGLDLSAAFNSRVHVIGGNTVTGSLGDVKLVGVSVLTWAQINAEGFVDGQGNQIMPASLGGAFRKLAPGTWFDVPVLTADPVVSGTDALTKPAAGFVRIYFRSDLEQLSKMDSAGNIKRLPAFT